METGKCSPHFQEDKKEDPGNYRPVSLTLLSDKIMEKIILEIAEKCLGATQLLVIVNTG